VADQVQPQVWVAPVQLPEQRSESPAADGAGALLHLEVGEASQRLPGTILDPGQGCAEQAGRRLLLRRHGGYVGKPSESLLRGIAQHRQFLMGIVLLGSCVGLAGQATKLLLELLRRCRIVPVLLEQLREAIEGLLLGRVGEDPFDVLDQLAIRHARRPIGQPGSRPVRLARVRLIGPSLRWPDDAKRAGGRQPRAGHPNLLQDARHLFKKAGVQPVRLPAVVIPTVCKHEQVGQAPSGQLAEERVDVGLVGGSLLIEADFPVR
jgi:hypothetical protein